MIANSPWLGGVDGAGGWPLEGALAYFAVAVLGPLTWILAVELCRRARAQQPEQLSVQREAAPSRLALLIAARNERGPRIGLGNHAG